jgi:DegV family protein with EDD domain
LIIKINFRIDTNIVSKFGMEFSMLRVITDSTSDLTLDNMKEMGIDIMPLTVRFGEEVYETIYEISNEEFFEKMATYEEKPCTSQVNPLQFEETFARYLKQGDEIICINIGSKLSGTYQSAVIAAREVNPEGDRISVIDTKSVSVVEIMAVERAIQMASEGKSLEEVTKSVLEMLQKARLYIMLENLDFLRHGGRISKEEYVAGENLGVKPIIKVDDTLSVADKVKGKKGMGRFFLKMLEKQGLEENSTIYICHGNAPEMAESFQNTLRENGIPNKVKSYCLGPIIGAHLGANCLGVGFLLK